MRFGSVVRRALALGGAGALLVLLAGGVSQASAASCEAGLTGGGPSGWNIDGGDGEFDDAALFTTLGGPDTIRDDTFDDYGQVEIDGNGYTNPNEQGCRRPKGKREILFPADNLGGIAVTPQLYVSKSRAFGRQFVSLRNTTAGSLTVEFAWDGNLGSDGNTVVGATTSGDASMNQDDRWGTTCDDNDGDGCADVVDEEDRDPELAHNWEGKGEKKHSADLVFDPELAGPADVRFQFDDVTIGAGKTVTFMQFVSLAPTIGAANKAAKAIDRKARKFGIFAKLSKREKRRLQNW